MIFLVRRALYYLKVGKVQVIIGVFNSDIPIFCHVWLFAFQFDQKVLDILFYALDNDKNSGIALIPNKALQIIIKCKAMNEWSKSHTLNDSLYGYSSPHPYDE